MPPARRDFAAYGRGSLIVPPARVNTPECISIGSDVLIHEHVWLEVQRTPQAATPSLVIGDNSIFNRFVKIVCLRSVRLGERTLIADRVYISDVEYFSGSPGGD
ncbi:MAG: hypothetical protein ACRDKS_13190, partial [Actinomycetota bacterium]